MDGHNLPEAGGAAQDGPVMDQHPVTRKDKVDGIVAQTRADVGDAGAGRVADVLRQRLADAGIETDDEELDRLTERVRS